MPRVLERLLKSEDAQPEKSSNKKRKGEPDVNWYDAVETTIQLVGWAKCESYRERRKLRQYKRAKKMNHISCVEGCKNNNEQKIIFSPKLLYLVLLLVIIKFLGEKFNKIGLDKLSSLNFFPTLSKVNN